MVAMVDHTSALAVTLTKSYVETLDRGQLVFTSKLLVITAWGKNDDMNIMFPNYYAGDLGEYPLCSLYTIKDAKHAF